MGRHPTLTTKKFLGGAYDEPVELSPPVNPPVNPPGDEPPKWWKAGWSIVAALPATTRFTAINQSNPAVQLQWAPARGISLAWVTWDEVKFGDGELEHAIGKRHFCMIIG